MLQIAEKTKQMVIIGIEIPTLLAARFSMLVNSDE